MICRNIVQSYLLIKKLYSKNVKRVEFETDAEDVRELPVPHDKMHFTQAEAAELQDYCHNDVYQTYVNYLYITGNCDNELYQGMNEVLLREQLSEKFGINCLNYSNSKYGDEIGKKEYAKELGIDIKDLPRKGTFRKNLYFKSCIPDFVKFKTDKLQKFLETLRKTVIGIKDDYEETLVIGNTKHTFALGGIHSDFQNKIYEADDEFSLIDWDVNCCVRHNPVNCWKAKV